MCKASAGIKITIDKKLPESNQNLIIPRLCLVD